MSEGRKWHGTVDEKGSGRDRVSAGVEGKRWYERRQDETRGEERREEARAEEMRWEKEEKQRRLEGSYGETAEEERCFSAVIEI